MKKEESHTQGPPWKNAGRFSTYESARAKLDELSSDEKYKDHQLKIRRMNDPESFIIKLRLHPDKGKKPAKKKPRGKKSSKKE